MIHGQLFGGIFGFGLAAQWAGIENVWYNDNNHFCCEVVRARIKNGQITDNVKIYEKDIKEIGKHNLAPVDIISGGVPCQPASNAGKRKGKADDRWQWPEAIRVVSELKPSVVIFENPPGILSLDNGKPFEEILFALENEGYEIELFDIPACSIEAEHRRSRIWIIAYINENRSKHDTRKIQSEAGKIKEKASEQYWKRMRGKLNTTLQKQIVTNFDSKRMERLSKKSFLWEQNIQDGQIIQPFQEANRRFNTLESRLCRTLYGIPFGVDRIRALGNSIVPEIALEIFKSINQLFTN